MKNILLMGNISNVNDSAHICDKILRFEVNIAINTMVAL